MHETTTDVETESEARFLAQLHYELALGNEITVTFMTAYEGDDQHELVGDTLVRVTETHPSWREDVRDEYLDTWWNVELVRAADVAAHAERGLGAPTADGPSYRILEHLRFPARDRVRE